MAKKTLLILEYTIYEKGAWNCCQEKKQLSITSNHRHRKSTREIVLPNKGERTGDRKYSLADAKIYIKNKGKINKY